MSNTGQLSHVPDAVSEHVAHVMANNLAPRNAGVVNNLTLSFS